MDCLPCVGIYETRALLLTCQEPMRAMMMDADGAEGEAGCLLKYYFLLLLIVMVMYSIHLLNW